MSFDVQGIRSPAAAVLINCEQLDVDVETELWSFAVTVSFLICRHMSSELALYFFCINQNWSERVLSMCFMKCRDT